MDLRSYRQSKALGYFHPGLLWGRPGFLWFIAMRAVVGCLSAAPPCLKVHFADKQPLISAASDDPAWRFADWQTLQPALGETAKQDIPTTRVALLWNKTDFFVRFHCMGTGQSPFGHTHDAFHHLGEVVEVFLDPSGDQRGFMELQLSPAGGVMDKWWTLDAPLSVGLDGLLTADYIRDHQHGDLSWTLTGLRVAAAPWKIDGRETGWIADLAIPWSAMAHPLPKADSILRAHFLRLAHPPDQTVSTSLTWAAVPVGRPHRAPALMGTLTLASSKPEAEHVR